MLQLGHLRYFYAVSQTRSIRKAADSLRVAQSAVSRQVKALEDELGVALFERHPRGVRLTDAGQILAKYAQQTILDLERIRSEIDDLRHLRRGTVRLCTVEAGIINLVPQVIQRFREHYPGVTMVVLVRGSRGVVETVLQDEADIGFAFNAPYHPEIQVIAQRQQQLFAALATDHPFAARKQVKLSDFATSSIGLPDASFGIRQLVDVIQRDKGLALEPALVTDSIQMLISFARLGLGVSFLPHFAIAGEVRSGKVAAVPLAEAAARNARAEILVHKGRKLPIPAEALLSQIERALDRLR